MAKDEKKTISVNDKIYDLAEFNEVQMVIVNHLADLERKLSNMRFNIDQLMVGRDAFINRLTASLEETETQPIEEAA